jgi:hypothetical protein
MNMGLGLGLGFGIGVWDWINKVNINGFNGWIL